VTRAALAWAQEELGCRLTALVFLGGTEKMRDGAAVSFQDVPVIAAEDMVLALRSAMSGYPSDVVIDLSDEPVLGYASRFRLISEALAAGLSYRGADFFFEAPSRPYACAKPAIGIWGTGKRVGKTALSGYAARRLLSGGSKPCVCTMGRGGPESPELIESPDRVTDSYLRARAEAGSHAASDHFEDAMMAGLVAVGCRRCGGGMAGEPFFSNVGEGAALACAQDADVLLFEGSGAAIPPVGVDSVMLVASATQPAEDLLAYLGPYRLLLSDLLVVTMCEDFLVSSEMLRKLIDGVFSINPEVKVVKTVFRPRPLGELRGRSVYLVSTAPRQAAERQARHIAEEHGATVIGTSSNLSDRKRLSADLEASAEAEVLLTELKAAGVDTVSAFAEEKGKELVYLENFPVPLDGDLGIEIDRLETLARKRSESR
jgi:cyclic 2,3-diphosphoglycerate synthase